MRIVSLLLTSSAVLLAGCGGPGSDRAGDDPEASAPAGSVGSEVLRLADPEGSPPPPVAAASSDQPSGLRVVFFGTSLTEGYGLARPETDAWPARIGVLADSAGIPVRIVNAGLSGETSAGALRRVDWILRDPPEVLVIETGANDGLRALSLQDMEANLDGMMARVREEAPGTRIVLVQMEAPPNLGPDYADEFREVFVRVAARWELPLLGFILDGVAGYPGLNQGDGIHPTAEGHAIMARNAWGVLDSLFREAPTP